MLSDPSPCHALVASQCWLAARIQILWKSSSSLGVLAVQALAELYSVQPSIADAAAAAEAAGACEQEEQGEAAATVAAAAEQRRQAHEWTAQHIIFPALR